MPATSRQPLAGAAIEHPEPIPREIVRWGGGGFYPLGDGGAGKSCPPPMEPQDPARQVCECYQKLANCRSYNFSGKLKDFLGRLDVPQNIVDLICQVKIVGDKTIQADTTSLRDMDRDQMIGLCDDLIVHASEFQTAANQMFLSLTFRIRELLRYDKQAMEELCKNTDQGTRDAMNNLKDNTCKVLAKMAHDPMQHVLSRHPQEGGLHNGSVLTYFQECWSFSDKCGLTNCLGANSPGRDLYDNLRQLLLGDWTHKIHWIQQEKGRKGNFAFCFDKSDRKGRGIATRGAFDGTVLSVLNMAKEHLRGKDENARYKRANTERTANGGAAAQQLHPFFEDGGSKALQDAICACQGIQSDKKNEAMAVASKRVVLCEPHAGFVVPLEHIAREFVENKQSVNPDGEPWMEFASVRRSHPKLARAKALLWCIPKKKATRNLLWYVGESWETPLCYDFDLQ